MSSNECKSDIYMNYFFENASSDWSLSGFKEYCNLNSSKPSTATVLKASYLKCLHSIKKDRKTPTHMKKGINELIQKANQEADSPPQPTVINYGSYFEYQNVEGDNYMVNSNQQPQPQPQPQQQQQQQKEEEEQQKEEEQQQVTVITSNSKRINNLPPFQFQPNDLPYYERRYFVDGCDISKGFHDFQVCVSTLLDTGFKLTLESHVHHIFSMSHIFLVSPKRMHSDIKNIMDSNTIDLLNKKLSAEYFLKEHQFSMDLFTTTVIIIKNVINKKINRTAAASKLLSLESKSKPMEFLIITSIMMMILYLPDDALNDNPKEMELINGYLHPCLSPLFHDPSNGVLFRWCDTINLEATKTAISISKRRPDNCITQLDGYEYDCNLGFGEVKSCHEIKNTAAISKDLIRLGIFSKNSIDIGNMNAVLCFQAIGRHVTFYVTKLMADGLYIMYELASLKVPGSIDELLSYVGHLDKILDILHVFHDQSYIMNPEQQQDVSNKKRKTLSTPDYATIIESTINNKRHCITKPNVQ